MELVLPASLEPEEIACAEEVAKDLELQTELVSDLLVYQTRPSLMPDHLSLFWSMRDGLA